MHDQPKIGEDEVVPRVVQRHLVSAHLAQRGVDLGVAIQGGVVDQLGDESLEMLERPRRTESRPFGVSGKDEAAAVVGQAFGNFRNSKTCRLELACQSDLVVLVEKRVLGHVFEIQPKHGRSALGAVPALLA